VCDDGSTDPETRAILAALTGDSRVRLVRSPSNAGIVSASNAALAAATGEFVALLDHDDELAPDALAEVARAIATDPATDVVYSDEDKIDARGARVQPHFKPDWSPELLRSCMYVSHLTVLRRTLIESAGGFRAGTEGAQDYDLLLRLSRQSPHVAHVPKVLYHWRITEGSAANSQLQKPWAVEAGRRALEEDARQRGADARVEGAGAAGHYRLRVLRPRLPAVAIVSSDAAARGGSGEEPFVLFCAPSVDRVSNATIEALLDLCEQPDVGVAGGFVFEPDGTIATGGIVLTGGVPRAAIHGEPAWTRGHLSNILDVRNCAAVSGVLLMTRRDVLRDVGGIDAAAGTLWDVDYCLRVRAAGLRIAVTPHARITLAGASRQALPQDLAALRARWGGTLDRDPYYNPNFAQQAASFRLPAPQSEDA
jgi:GT2 family glycosyltransferase